MASVAVVDSHQVPLRPGSVDRLSVRPTVGSRTGFDPLEQAVLECAPGRTDPIRVLEAEETLFVLAGRGTVHVAGDSYRLEPEVGIYIAPGQEFALENPGPEPLRLVAVRIPDPVPANGDQSPTAAVRSLADQELEQATTQREFRVVADPTCGLRSATHFVGYIPTARAPEHFHTYDEVIYVLDGRGVMHAGEFEQSLAAGSCIQLPARTVHCLENTGEQPMRVVGVFRPAGSPAAAYYPDGTPAYQG
ncbi:MAG TPA: cupin domain-containing protein [Solirubrobacteraceae bacterium]|jgi:mannose-6-phosphate isomerase-like protein (cupin superfamily)